MSEDSTGRTKLDSDRTKRDSLNRGLQEEEERLQDPERRPPHHGMEGDTPEPERPATQDKADEDIAHLENPPQTEGPRERSNEGKDS
jgi:hypothetical protein